MLQDGVADPNRGGQGGDDQAPTYDVEGFLPNAFSDYDRAFLGLCTGERCEELEEGRANGFALITKFGNEPNNE